MPTLRVFRLILTSRSLPLYFASMLIVMSRSLMVWSHLYGSAACSACSCARAAASAFARSSGGGEPDMVFARCAVAGGDKSWAGVSFDVGRRTLGAHRHPAPRRPASIASSLQPSPARIYS
jgi:hypothetical protein